MSIGYFGELAFGTGVVLTSLTLNEPVTIQAMGSQHVVVPVGEASMERHCMIRLNDTGAFLWEQLGANTTEDVLVRALLAEYAVDEDTARADVAVFLGELRDADLLEE